MLALRPTAGRPVRIEAIVALPSRFEEPTCVCEPETRVFVWAQSREERRSCRIPAGDAAKDEAVRDGAAAEAACAVHSTRDLSRSKEPRDRMAIDIHDPAVHIDADSAHRVVYFRPKPHPVVGRMRHGDCAVEDGLAKIGVALPCDEATAASASVCSP